MKVFALICFFAAAIPAVAHHSVAMFDRSQTVTITGTIKEFQWTNPHVVIWITSDKDDRQLWAIECTSPGVLTRNGWTKRSLQAGDQVTIEAGPLRDGKPGGLFKKATVLETGKVLTYVMQPQDGPGQ
jgi:hypothetical protein